ncbi:MAG TPA: hypothetical protein VFP33_03580, partial [Gallionella sp.]|nr:hypothetical protein [Gallionella sp.]
MPKMTLLAMLPSLCTNNLKGLGATLTIELWALRYFRDDRIDQITENKLGDYIEWRLNQPRRPAVASLKNERTALR